MELAGLTGHGRMDKVKENRKLGEKRGGEAGRRGEERIIRRSVNESTMGGRSKEGVRTRGRHDSKSMYIQYTSPPLHFVRFRLDGHGFGIGA